MKISLYVQTANSLPLTGAFSFMWGAYFCMGAYKRHVVVVIKMDAYIHGFLFSMGTYYPDFTVY